MTTTATTASNGAHVPPGERLYAIGDVHGRLDLLTRLLDTIERDDTARGAAETRIILLGDSGRDLPTRQGADRGNEGARVWRIFNF